MSDEILATSVPSTSVVAPIVAPVPAPVDVKLSLEQRFDEFVVRFEKLISHLEVKHGIREPHKDIR